MATVNVTSWAEFLAAVAVAGDTVVLPEAAEWDLSEAETITTPIEISCAEIQGNDTVIKGTKFEIAGYCIRNTVPLTVTAMHWESVYAKCHTAWWKEDAALDMSESAVSGQFVNTGGTLFYVFRGVSNFTSCAANVSCPDGGNLLEGVSAGSGISRFCRYQIFTTSSSTSPFMYDISPFNYCEKCELIINAPNATGIGFWLGGGVAKISGCSVRGTVGVAQQDLKYVSVSDYRNYWLTVLSDTIAKAPDYSVSTAAFSNGIVCSEAQLRSADYLGSFESYQHSIFPLGDGDEDWHTGDIEVNGGYPYIPKMIDLPRLELRPVEQSPYISLFDIGTRQDEFEGNGIAILTPSECTTDETLNGAWTFSMQHPLDPDGKWQEIKLRNLVRIDGQLFTILTVDVQFRNNSGYLTCTGEHIWYQLGDGWIFPGDIISGATGEAFITNVKARTETFGTDMASMVYDFTGHSDIVPTAPIVKDCAEGCTAIDALIGSGGLVDQSDSGYAELYRDNFYYSINNRMEGAIDNAFDIRIGRDLRGIRRTFDTTQFVSYFGCYDKWGNYFAVSWVLNQFMARNFPHHIVRTKTFSDDGLDVWEFGFTPLIAKGMAFFRRNCKPIISYEIDLEDVRNNPDFSIVMHTDRFRVGDSGTVYDERLGGNLTVKISGITYDAIRNKVVKVTIGDQLHFSAPAASTVDIEPEVVGGRMHVIDPDGAFCIDPDGKQIIQEVRVNG